MYILLESIHDFDKGPGGSRGLSHLAGSGLQPVGEIQNGLGRVDKFMGVFQ